MFPPVPANESGRFTVVDRNAVPGPPREPFDELVELAASICGVPIAQISLEESGRQWFRAAIEVSAQALACAAAFFDAMGGEDVFVVEDAQAHSRSAGNAFVRGEPFIRFYAGAPLVSPDGRRLGTLCVIDTKPRRFDDTLKVALVTLARQAMMQLELRREVDELRLSEARAQSIILSGRHEVERMKGEFISTVSHELRTPLTSIYGSLGLLDSGVVGDLPGEAKAMVSVAQRNSVRLLALIDDILDFDRLESGSEMRMVPVSLTRLVERAIETIRPLAAQEGVRIELQASDAQICGDEKRLEQVMANLLSNAVKYSPRDGLVTVQILPAGEAFEVRVQDRGRGIGGDLQKKLFRRFQRAGSDGGWTRPGAGLGLATCKAIVDRHGGTIGVVSHEGEGSTFWFRIPRPAGELDGRYPRTGA